MGEQDMTNEGHDTSKTHKWSERDFFISLNSMLQHNSCFGQTMVYLYTGILLKNAIQSTADADLEIVLATSWAKIGQV